MGRKEAEKATGELGVIAHICNPRYLESGGWGIVGPRLAPCKSMRPYLKNKQKAE
jgi:hypothetical protein